jgi:hypothetical protein
MAIENIYERCHVMAKMKLPVKDTLKDQLKVPPCLGAHPQRRNAARQCCVAAQRVGCNRTLQRVQTSSRNAVTAHRVAASATLKCSQCKSKMQP